MKAHARIMHIFQTGNKIFLSLSPSVCLQEASDLCPCTVYTCTLSASPWSSLQSSRLSPSRQPVPGRRMSICNQLEIFKLSSETMSRATSVVCQLSSALWRRDVALSHIKYNNTHQEPLCPSWILVARLRTGGLKEMF